MRKPQVRRDGCLGLNKVEKESQGVILDKLICGCYPMAEIIAKNSLEYFIAFEERSDLKSLQKQIGKEAHILTRTEIENVVRETFSI